MSIIECLHTASTNPLSAGSQPRVAKEIGRLLGSTASASMHVSHFMARCNEPLLNQATATVALVCQLTCTTKPILS